MEKLKQLYNLIDGHKTDLIASLTALDGLWQYFVQHGSNWRTLVVYLLFGGGTAAMRDAIRKNQATS